MQVIDCRASLISWGVRLRIKSLRYAFWAVWLDFTFRSISGPSIGHLSSGRKSHFSREAFRPFPGSSKAILGSSDRSTWQISQNPIFPPVVSCHFAAGSPPPSQVGEVVELLSEPSEQGPPHVAGRRKKLMPKPSRRTGSVDSHPILVGLFCRHMIHAVKSFPQGRPA